MVVFGDEVTKILRNSLFIFHFILPILPYKRKTSYRKSRNLSDEKTKNEVTKICDEPGKKHIKLPPNVAYFSLISENFSVANQLKTSPNLFFFHKNCPPRDLYIMTLTLPKAIKRLSYMLVHDRQKRNAVIIVTFCFMCVATALAVVSFF